MRDSIVVLRCRGLAGAIGIASLLALTVVGCSSSSGSDAGSGSPGSSVETPEGEASDAPVDGDVEAATQDACQWYTADDMSALLGFDVVMTPVEDPVLGATCEYDSEAKFTKVTVVPRTVESYDTYKKDLPTYSPDATIIQVEGLGDDAWTNNDQEFDNFSQALEVKTADAAVSVQLATSGDAIADWDTSDTIVSTIATTVLGL